MKKKEYVGTGLTMLTAYDQAASDMANHLIKGGTTTEISVPLPYKVTFKNTYPNETWKVYIK